MYICIHTKNIKYDMLKAFMRSNLLNITRKLLHIGIYNSISNKLQTNRTTPLKFIYSHQPSSSTLLSASPCDRYICGR